MTVQVIIITFIAYFASLFAMSRIVSGKNDNLNFFSGGRKHHWLYVSVSMIGACMSGITYISVPGMVKSSGFSYLQMCLGFMCGYFIIAFVLIPVFYKLNVISIYEYLNVRFGKTTYKSGSAMFFICKLSGASVKFFLLCISQQIMLFDKLNIPFEVNAAISIMIVFAYTYRGGVKSVLITDIFKTVTMISSVILCTVFISRKLNLNFMDFTDVIIQSPMSKIFEFENFKSPSFFVKQFLSGIFIVIAMTGLDQDMMQRALSCKNYRDSQKNMIISTFMQTIVITMFLCLGILLYTYASTIGLTAESDSLFPAVATNSGLPTIAGIFFLMGFLSCAYSVEGSSLTALTTAFTIDILGMKGKEEKAVMRKRKIVHAFMAIAMFFCVIIFKHFNESGTINAIFKIASYTYGPILGLFSFGFFTKWQIKGKFVPLILSSAPILCLILQINSEKWFNGYSFGYEILILNALFTFIGLCMVKKRKDENNQKS